MHIELPGLFDLQVNGFAGVDFNGPGLTADRIAEALGRIRTTGVTRCLPTLITSSFDTFAASARILAGISDATIVGIHMEGPYIAPEDGPRGAHSREHVTPASLDDFKRRQEAAGGRILLVTLAPEVPGALELIEFLVASGVRVAVGHSSADPQRIGEAIAAGATLSTHLGNGCAPSLPRHPNLLWEQLAADSMMASLIVDGHHLPPATVTTFVRAKGIDRTILVTDAVAAAGCPPGSYTIGEAACALDEHGRVSLQGTSSLAGSALTLPRAIANTVRFTRLPFEAVIPMASTIPAAYLGLSAAGSVEADWDEESFELHIRSVTTA